MVDTKKVDENYENGGWQELMTKDLQLKVIDSGGEDKNDSIEHQEAFLISFEGRTADNRSIMDGQLFQKVDNWLIVIGGSDILPALEMGIRFMKVGETALIWSHSKFALGRGTRTFIEENDSTNNTSRVPPNSSVLYKVKVERKVMDTSRLNPYFTIQKALTKKKIANDVYQNEWCPPPKTSEDPDCDNAMNRAIRLYTKAAKEMEALLQGTYFRNVESDHPQKLESKQLLLDSLNNIVAVYLKQKKYHEAKLSAVEVLKVDPNNIKGLMRAAKAAILDPASTLEEASAAIQAAESYIATGSKKKSVDEKELARLKVQLKEREAKYKEQTKKMFANKLASKSTKASDSKADSEFTAETSSGTTLSDENTEDVSARSFWKNQMYTVVVQFIIPMIVISFMKFFSFFRKETGADENTKTQ